MRLADITYCLCSPYLNLTVISMVTMLITTTLLVPFCYHDKQVSASLLCHGWYGAKSPVHVAMLRSWTFTTDCPGSKRLESLLAAAGH
jgi:hypothetical protein